MGVSNVTVTLRSSRQVVKRICEIDKEPEDWRWQDVFGFVDFLASHLAGRSAQSTGRSGIRLSGKNRTATLLAALTRSLFASSFSETPCPRIRHLSPLIRRTSE